MLLLLQNFSGIAPRFEPEMLAAEAAQQAQNVFLERMSLRPIEDARTLAVTLAKAGTIQSIYRFGQGLTDEAQHWFHWTSDVDVVRGPIPTDTTERTYFTGDGEPKYTDATIGPGAGNMPAASFTLGIPRPVSPLAAVVSGAGGGTQEYRFYVYTYVSNYNGYVQEGKPSAPTASIAVEDGQSVDLSGFIAFPSGYNLTGVRVYCAGADGVFRMVADHDGAVPSSITDSNSPDERAELPLLDSETYDMPPADLACLSDMGNGVLVGASADRSIRFCEPYLPHAWPTTYELLTANKWVGIGTFKQTTVVLTTDFPELIYGVDPSSMAQEPLRDFHQSCVSKASIASGDNGVFYASPNGLCRVGADGVAVLTDAIFTQEDWQALNPESIRGEFIDGKYVGFYDNGTKGGFAFDPSDQRAPFVFLDSWGSATFVDHKREALYYVDQSRALKRWRGAENKKTYLWRSKVFESDTYFRFKYCEMRVSGDGAAYVKIIGDGRTIAMFSAFGDGVHIKGKTLPRCRRIEVEITGNAAIRQVRLATSRAELNRGQ